MAKVERISSVDILRGWVMFTMIFVNCGFFMAPWWAEHYATDGNGNGITYVDVIFPAFLFLAGVAIPLAFERYQHTFKDGVTKLYHVLYRSATLMIMGLLYVNDSYSKEMGFSRPFWFATALLIICLTWQQYKGENRYGKWLSNILRLAGLAGLIGFFYYYKSASGLEIRPSWWGILGLIGRAYMIGALFYMIVGKRAELMMLAVLLVSMMHVASFGGELNSWWWFTWGDRVSIVAGQSSITMLGVVCGIKLLKLGELPGSTEKHKEMLKFLVIFAALSGAVGVVLNSWYGLHKNSTFPAYVYTAVAITIVMWIVIYLACDVWKMNNFITRFFQQVGSVPLTAYVMSSLVTNVLRIIPPLPVMGDKSYFDILFKSLAPLAHQAGLPLWSVQVIGALQTLFFVLVVTFICIGLKKRKIFLKI